MGKRAFVLRRLFHAALALFGLMTVTFLIFRIMPGDPLSTLVAGGRLDPQAQEQIRAQFGLDQPIFVQYFRYLANLLTGNFGTSFFYNQSVSEIVGRSLLNTAVLVLPAMVTAIIASVLLGAYLGWKSGGKLEILGVTISLVVYSLPVFWLSIILLMIFVYWLGWFPSGGMFTPGAAEPGLRQYFSIDFLRHLAMPFLASFLFYFPVTFFVMRNSMIEVKGEEFLDFVKAKGVSEFGQIKHGLRNGLLPVVTYVAVMATLVIEGNVMLEVVFAWPGIGREIVTSVLRRDYPIAQGAFFLMGVVLIAMNLLADLVYGYLDPRITYE